MGEKKERKQIKMGALEVPGIGKHVALLSKVIEVSLIEKMTFEQRLAVNKGVNYADILGKSIPG